MNGDSHQNNEAFSPQVITLFVPCLVDQFYPEVAVSTIKILRFLGFDVVYPSQQTCCGQPAFNAGHRKEAVHLAQHFLSTFQNAEIIVCPSGSCVGMVKNHFCHLDLSPQSRTTSLKVKDKIFEFSDFVFQKADLESFQGKFPHKVLIHDSCHGLRELGLKKEPREILSSLADIELVSIPWGQDDCCGFGGTFSVTYPAISSAMAYDKAKALIDSGAEYFVTNDVSCLMQISGALSRLKGKIIPIHFASLLAKALGM